MMLQVRHDAGVSRTVISISVSSAQALREIQNIMELHCPIPCECGIICSGSVSSSGKSYDKNRISCFITYFLTLQKVGCTRLSVPDALVELFRVVMCQWG